MEAKPKFGPSNRKPFNQEAGYVASLRSGKGKGFVVIYEAEQQGFDVDGKRYAVFCKTHNTLCGETSLPKARVSMKNPANFCEGCQA